MTERRPALQLLVTGLLLAAGAALPAGAVTGKEWIIRSRSDYDKAHFENATLTPEARVILSPAVRPLAEVSQPVLWCLAEGKDGVLYAGGGNEGRVWRITPSGADVVFDAPEVEVQAIAIDEAGTLYAGASPGGKVYRVTEPGKSEMFFDAQATYVWALQFLEGGDLLVATGQPGRIYRVQPGGKASVLLDSRDDHVRALVPDGAGGFLAGTDGGGVVYEIDAQGKPSVLFDSSEREIAAIAVLRGDVYAAALSPLQGRPGGAAASAARGNVTHVRVTAEGSSEVNDDDDDDDDDQQQQQQRSAAQQRQAQRPQPEERFSGAVYRISPQGFGRKIWESNSDIVLSLLPAPDGQLLAGLGSGGRILALSPEGDSSETAFLPAEQISAMLRAGSKVIAATSNMGAVYEISSGYAKEGTVLGEVRDAGYTSTWGAVSWDAETPQGTSMFLQVRTGDTEEPDGTWSEWSKPYTDPARSVIDRPKARFLQWKATLHSRGEATPLLKAAYIHYLPENMPPVIETVEALAPGVYLQSMGPASPADAGSDTRARRMSQPKRSFEKGMQSITWQASDSNEDPLEAEVQFRAEDETAWKTMQSGILDNFFAWDSTAMPDGAYRVRVIVSDASGNPPGKGLEARRISPAFEIDNTPPVVSEMSAHLGSRSAEVAAVITDTFSPIVEIAYSVDAAEWVVVLPEDGMADRPRETVRFTTKELASGEHSIVVRARDRAGNTSAGKTLVQVP